MNRNQQTSTFPWGAILFLIFLVLKLTGNINWSWWWIAAPLWIPLSIFIAIWLIIGIVVLLAVLFDR